MEKERVSQHASVLAVHERILNVETDAVRAVEAIAAHIDAKRTRLGI